MQTGRELIARDNIEVREEAFIYQADMQFQGQSHMLPVTISGPGVTLSELQKRFDEVYWERFGVELPEIRAVLVNVHTAIIGKRDSIDLSSLQPSNESKNLKDARIGERDVMFNGKWHKAVVYQRDMLPLAFKMSGPAIINQLDTTIVIEPDCTAIQDNIGNLIVEVPND